MHDVSINHRKLAKSPCQEQGVAVHESLEKDHLSSDHPGGKRTGVRFWDLILEVYKNRATVFAGIEASSGRSPSESISFGVLPLPLHVSLLITLVNPQKGPE